MFMTYQQMKEIKQSMQNVIRFQKQCNNANRILKGKFRSRYISTSRHNSDKNNSIKEAEYHTYLSFSFYDYLTQYISVVTF